MSTIFHEVSDRMKYPKQLIGLTHIGNTMFHEDIWCGESLLTILVQMKATVNSTPLATETACDNNCFEKFSQANMHVVLIIVYWKYFKANMVWCALLN